jgi:hypothetical protein
MSSHKVSARTAQDYKYTEHPQTTKLILPSEHRVYLGSESIDIDLAWLPGLRVGLFQAPSEMDGRHLKKLVTQYAGDRGFDNWPGGLGEVRRLGVQCSDRC